MSASRAAANSSRRSNSRAFAKTSTEVRIRGGYRNDRRIGVGVLPCVAAGGAVDEDRARCHHVHVSAVDHRADQPEEPVEGVPVLAEVRALEPVTRQPLLAVQAAAAAGAGFVAGAATLALVRRRSDRKLARSRRRVLRRRDQGLPVLASRTFLIDVHLLAKPGE
jgi:hypothetical protein